MLLIRRRVGESLLIGSNVEIQILEISPNRVKLGIVAPAEVSVVRQEMQLTREQNRIAAGNNSDSIAAFLRNFQR